MGNNERVSVENLLLTRGYRKHFLIPILYDIESFSHNGLKIISIL